MTLHHIIRPNTIKIAPQKTCNIAYNFYGATVASTAIDTTKPGTPNFSITATSYFPSYTGDLMQKPGHIGVVLAGVANTNGSSARTLNWDIYRNGISVNTGSGSIPASNKGTVNFTLTGANEPVSGDTIDVYLWCTESGTDCVVNRKGLAIVPGIIRPVNTPHKLLANVTFSLTNNTTPPSNFTASYTYQVYMYLSLVSGSTIYVPPSVTLSVLPYLAECSAYGILRLGLDMSPSNVLRTHATAYNFDQLEIPSVIKWSETNIILP